MRAPFRSRVARWLPGLPLPLDAQVELESLQEQLRVRKEKQYSLLERTQAAEEAKRQSDDQVGPTSTLHPRARVFCVSFPRPPWLWRLFC
jgi:hypothetical protein